MQGSAYRQSQPQLTELAKELMIPGSTKQGNSDHQEEHLPPPHGGE